MFAFLPGHRLFDGEPDANTDDEDEQGAEPEDDEGEGRCPVGSSVEVGGHTWQRVQTMGGCSRGAKARKELTLIKFTFASETTKKEVWEHLSPVSLHKMLAVVKENAGSHDEKTQVLRGRRSVVLLRRPACRLPICGRTWRVEEETQRDDAATRFRQGDVTRPLRSMAGMSFGGAA